MIRRHMKDFDIVLCTPSDTEENQVTNSVTFAVRSPFPERGRRHAQAPFPTGKLCGYAEAFGASSSLICASACGKTKATLCRRALTTNETQREEASQSGGDSPAPAAPVDDSPLVYQGVARLCASLEKRSNEQAGIRKRQGQLPGGSEATYASRGEKFEKLSLSVRLAVSLCIYHEDDRKLFI